MPLVDMNFDLLVFKSISHSLAELTQETYCRLDHLKIKFVSTHSRQRYYVHDGTVTGFVLFRAFQ